MQQSCHCKIFFYVGCWVDISCITNFFIWTHQSRRIRFNSCPFSSTTCQQVVLRSFQSKGNIFLIQKFSLKGCVSQLLGRIALSIRRQCNAHHQVSLQSASSRYYIPQEGKHLSWKFSFYKCLLFNDPFQQHHLICKDHDVIAHTYFKYSRFNNISNRSYCNIINDSRRAAGSPGGGFRL